MLERFDGRVSLEWDIAPEALPVALPALSLQPLLENVFKHTVERRRGPVAIRVHAALDDGALVLQVEDDAGALQQQPQRNNGAGIALANLRTRLAALHGEHAGLSLAALAPSGVRAEMRVPCAS